MTKFCVRVSNTFTSRVSPGATLGIAHAYMPARNPVHALGVEPRCNAGVDPGLYAWILTRIFMLGIDAWYASRRVLVAASILVN